MIVGKASITLVIFLAVGCAKPQDLESQTHHAGSGAEGTGAEMDPLIQDSNLGGIFLSAEDFREPARFIDLTKETIATEVGREPLFYRNPPEELNRTDASEAACNHK